MDSPTPVGGPYRAGSTFIENSKRYRAAAQSNWAQSKVARSAVQRPPDCTMSLACFPSTANQLPTSRTRYSPMKPGYPPGLPPLPLPESGGAVGGEGLLELEGRPVMTSGTPGSTPPDPMYATNRTT